MKSNIQEKLEEFFGESVINLARKLNYSEDNILILESNEAKLKELYPETYSNLLSCKHNRDSRTSMEYAQYLVSSWVFEDYLLQTLNDVGLNIRLSGEDRTRKLLKSSKIKSSSDYFIEYKGKTAFIELANDYTGYWKKNGQCDLRDDKYLHIKSEGEKSNYSLLLGIDFVNNKFFIIDLNLDNLNVKYSDYFFAYGKPAYSIMLDSVEFIDFNVKNICSKIFEIMD